MTGAEKPRQPDASDVPGPEDWTESPDLASPQASAHEMAQYAAMLRRVERMILIAGACAAAVSLPFGWVLAAGVLLGALLGWINFRWLERTVSRLGQKRASVGMSVLAGLRYALLGLGAYVILRFSKISLPAALAGLFVSVAAVLMETIIQIWYARNLDH